jgi:antitoxin component YwqK of YwqJK toxin-antitoxin module
MNLDIYILAHPLSNMWTKKGNIMQYAAFVGGEKNGDWAAYLKKFNQYIRCLNILNKGTD